MSDGDRDSKPEKFSSLLGPEPAWLKCTCGALTSRVPCWDCDRAMMARVDADRARAIAAGSIPSRYAWARSDSPLLGARVKLRDPVDTVVRRVLGASRVVFSGPSGAGKTSLAAACLRDRGAAGLFVSALRLGTARIQTHAGQGEAALVERAMEAPVLLIDELGGEQRTTTNAVRDVIFARHDADLTTWVTTGFRGAQLAEMYGDGMLRRLTEGAYVVALGAT